MKFYKPSGQEIDIEQFIELYSKAYFLGNVAGDKIPGLKKNSKFSEEEIERVSIYGIKTEDDLIHIFAWKAGKLRHSLATENQPFVYYDKWLEKAHEKYDGFIEYLLDNMDKISKEESPEIIINQLKKHINDNQISGIGPVYLITLLFFVSKRAFPIYDKFAWLALQAILEDQNPLLTKGIDYCSPPDIKSKHFDEFISEKYCKEYIGFLHLFFDEDYKYRREIDQALWTYGHLFNKKKNKGC